MHDFCRRLPWTVPAHTYYAECLELIQEAERLGYDAVWLPEHHGRADGFLPSPLVAAAAIAARTSRIRNGTNVLLLPLHHPLRVAEDGAGGARAVLGRLVLGLGQGYAPHEFARSGWIPGTDPVRGGSRGDPPCLAGRPHRPRRDPVHRARRPAAHGPKANAGRARRFT